jgi:hypothetical protein
VVNNLIQQIVSTSFLINLGVDRLGNLVGTKSLGGLILKLHNELSRIKQRIVMRAADLISGRVCGAGDDFTFLFLAKQFQTQLGANVLVNGLVPALIANNIRFEQRLTG